MESPGPMGAVGHFTVSGSPHHPHPARAYGANHTYIAHPTSVNRAILSAPRASPLVLTENPERPVSRHSRSKTRRNGVNHARKLVTILPTAIPRTIAGITTTSGQSEWSFKICVGVRPRSIATTRRVPITIVPAMRRAMGFKTKRALLPAGVEGSRANRPSG
jgi:hypothetical protein